MKLVAEQPKGQKVMPFLTIFLLVALSLTLAGWQMYNTSSKANSALSVYLPVFQAGLMVMVVVLGLVFHSLRSARIKSHDILGLKHDGVGSSFKNTEALLGSAAGAIVRLNKEFEIEYFNEKAEKYTGWTKDQAEGLSIFEILQLQNTNDIETLRHMLEQVMDLSEPKNDEKWTELKLVNKDSQLHLMKSKASAVFDKQGEVEHVVLILQDITSDRKAMEDLYDQASRDSLTGLINRQSFQGEMEAVLSNTQGTENVNVLCYMDMDHFKQVNDVCGHAAGDELLRQISSMFSKRVRGTDKVARIGGDEFAIILPKCGIKTAEMILNRILDDIRAYRFVWRQNTFTVGLSIGAIEFDSSFQVTDAGYLMVKADEACYSAKKAGRDRVVIKDVYEEVDSDEEDEATSWESMIKQAIQSDEFELHLLPMHRLNTDEEMRRPAEVLLRLRHEGQLLEPGSFMPTAERLGLMGQVDRWVIEKTIGRLSQESMDDFDFIFSINLSADSVNDLDFVEYVTLLIKEYDIDPSMLCFEVSESIALANFSRVQEMFSQFATLGICSLLDDFGSGFSSLNYLRELPIKYLKIDGSFVRKISKNKVDAAMVEAVNQVVQTMNLYTVAENVENEVTVKLLDVMGVNYAQGYYYEKPFPLEEVFAQSQAA